MYTIENLIKALKLFGTTDVGAITIKVGICEQVSENAKSYREEELRHKQKIDALKNQLSKIQSRCSHDLWTCHPDLSGSNDFYTECDICGKEI